MTLFEVKFEIPVQLADSVNDALIELGDEGWSMLEDVIVNRAWVVGIFRSKAEAEERPETLFPLLGLPRPVDLTVRELADSEWRDSYKAHFHAWQFGRLHWVPIWEKPTFRLTPGDEVLWLDPGLAFGTGNHETTRLCVERLVRLAETSGTSGRVIDAGCGSGILALSAAKLGFRDILGFDNDPEAVRVSLENAALNDLGDAVQFSVGDLMSGLRGQTAEIVMANILAHILIEFRRELTSSISAGGTLILSGILAAESYDVQRAFTEVSPGWTVQSRAMGEWCDVVVSRPQTNRF
ncbi:MAG: 50S ribosomal protein L11 methyltransferase [Opitutus sp.]